MILPFAMAYYNKGVFLSKLGSYQGALQACNLAIKYKPDLAEAYHNKGVILEKLGRINEAKAAFKKAQELKAKQ